MGLGDTALMKWVDGLIKAAEQAFVTTVRIWYFPVFVDCCMPV